MPRISFTFILWFWKTYRQTITQAYENIWKVWRARCTVITDLKYSRHTVIMTSTCSMRLPARRFIVTTDTVILPRVSVTSNLRTHRGAISLNEEIINQDYCIAWQFSVLHYKYLFIKLFHEKWLILRELYAHLLE